MDDPTDTAFIPRLDKRKRRKNARKKKPALPATKRGEEAKTKLKKATAKLLRRLSYRELRLSDIVDEAGYNIGAFYYYFKDKQSIVKEVIQELFPHDAQVAEYRKHAIAADELYSIIYEMTLSQARAYASNPRLMRSIAQFADDEPELAEVIYHRNQLWNDLVADDIRSRFPNRPPSTEFSGAMAMMLNGAVEAFLTDLYVLKKPTLTKVFKTEEQAARFIAIFWWRALFLENPPQEDLDPFSEFQGLSKADADRHRPKKK